MTTTFKQLLKKVTNCSETNIPKWEGSGFAFFGRFCANFWWCVTYHFQSDYLFFVTKAVKKMSSREVIFGKIWLTSMYIAFQIVLAGICILVHGLIGFCILYSNSFNVAPYTRVFTNNPRYLTYVTERNLTCLVSLSLWFYSPLWLLICILEQGLNGRTSITLQNSSFFGFVTWNS